MRQLLFFVLFCLSTPTVGFTQESNYAIAKMSKDQNHESAFCKGKDLKDLPPPYNELEELLPYNGHGWYNNRREMAKLLKKVKPKVVVELGSWLGQSTCHIAKTISKKAKVYAVDHWLGSPEHQDPDRPTHNVYSLLPTLYEQFLSNVIHKKLTHKIIPWRMTTREAARKMATQNIRVDLIYVDASHDEESVYQDLCDWYPFVQNHGVLCGDDWSWGINHHPVQRAVKRFAKEHHLRIATPNRMLWILLRK